MKKSILIVSSICGIFSLTAFTFMNWNNISSEFQGNACKKVNSIEKGILKCLEQGSDLDPSAQIAKNIFEIFEDSHGNIWFGTADQGVARLDFTASKGSEENVLKYYNTDDGLCGNTVANMAEGKDGKLWFGTYSDMCRVDQNANNSQPAFIPFESNDNVPLLGWGWKSVKTDRKGNIWVNTHHGIFQFQDEKFTEFKVPVNTEGNFSFCSTPGVVTMQLIDSQGNIWFGTDGDGAYMYSQNGNEDKSFIHFTVEDGLTSNYVASILEDKQGNMLFACISNSENSIGEGGLCRLNMNKGNNFTQFQNLDGLHNNSIYTLYKDRSDNIWIGATGVGLYRYDGNQFTLYREPEGVDLTSTVHISGLQSMLEDSKGRLWLGYSGGLFRLEGETMVNITRKGPWG
jgi:ligand-binding sensor domain-containing protein